MGENYPEAPAVPAPMQQPQPVVRVTGGPAPELAAAMAETRHYRKRIEALADEWQAKAEQIEAKPFGKGQMGACDIGRAHAYRDCAKQVRAALEARDDG